MRPIHSFQIKMTETLGYYLSPFVSYCYIDNASVFLDRKNDKYKYVDRATTEAIRALSSETSLQNPSTASRNTTQLLESMATAQLLTHDSAKGKQVAATQWKTASLSVYDIFWQRQFSISSTARLFRSFVLATRYMADNNFLQVQEYAQSLKKKPTSIIVARKKHSIVQQARRFIDGRALLYSYYDKCLLDSFIFFLCFSSLKIPVHWVFGVNLYPFRAHCWIEYDGTVLNDTTERVGSFTPIYVL